MQAHSEHQALVDFFSGRPLPTGPQHVNEYSVFLDLAGAVKASLQQLDSRVEATQKSAASLLDEVKQWLIRQEITE